MELDTGSWIVLGVASLVAVVSLAQLMNYQRNRLLTRLRNEMEQERINKQRAEQRKKAEEAQKNQRQAGRGSAA